MQYVLLGRDNVVVAASDRPLTGGGQTLEIETPGNPADLVGRRVAKKNLSDLKLAVVCNWRTACGISTYSKYLVDALRPKVREVKIFSEVGPDLAEDQNDNVVRCWKRGESMRSAIKEIKDWGADFVIIQHEFGIFPHGMHFLKMLHDLATIPYAVMLHSVYTHLDKTVSTSAIQNILVHSKEAKAKLIETGHDGSHVQVIPHGCVVFDDVKELWNSFQTPYAIIQFGFGFQYKGVDRVIEAIAHLKKTDPKFHNIFYCYLCSTTTHAKNTQNEYTEFLARRVEELGVEDNVAIIQKFHTDQIINNYLRTAKMALFHYTPHQDNIVYGASGAIRIAMANEIPVIASDAHLFDDLEGVIPRPGTVLELASAIDEIFSDNKKRVALLDRSKKFIRDNSWDVTADRYLAAIDHILDNGDFLRV